MRPHGRRRGEARLALLFPHPHRPALSLVPRETSVVIETFYEDDRDRRAPGLRCTVPCAGGAIECSVQAPLVVEEAPAGSLFLSVASHAPVDGSLCAFVTLKQLDAIVAGLTALRDRARTEGLLDDEPRGG